MKISAYLLILAFAHSLLSLQLEQPVQKQVVQSDSKNVAKNQNEFQGQKKKQVVKVSSAKKVTIDVENKYGGEGASPRSKTNDNDKVKSTKTTKKKSGNVSTQERKRSARNAESSNDTVKKISHVPVQSKKKVVKENAVPINETKFKNNIVLPNKTEVTVKKVSPQNEVASNVEESNSNIQFVSRVQLLNGDRAFCLDNSYIANLHAALVAARPHVLKSYRTARVILDPVVKFLKSRKKEERTAKMRCVEKEIYKVLQAASNYFKENSDPVCLSEGCEYLRLEHVEDMIFALETHTFDVTATGEKTNMFHFSTLGRAYRFFLEDRKTNSTWPNMKRFYSIGCAFEGHGALGKRPNLVNLINESYVATLPDEWKIILVKDWSLFSERTSKSNKNLKASRTSPSYQNTKPINGCNLMPMTPKANTLDEYDRQLRELKSAIPVNELQNWEPLLNKALNETMAFKAKFPHLSAETVYILNHAEKRMYPSLIRDGFPLFVKEKMERFAFNKRLYNVFYEEEDESDFELPNSEMAVQIQGDFSKKKVMVISEVMTLKKETVYCLEGPYFKQLFGAVQSAYQYTKFTWDGSFSLDSQTKAKDQLDPVLSDFVLMKAKLNVDLKCLEKRDLKMFLSLTRGLKKCLNEETCHQDLTCAFNIKAYAANLDILLKYNFFKILPDGNRKYKIHLIERY